MGATTTKVSIENAKIGLKVILNPKSNFVGQNKYGDVEYSGVITQLLQELGGNCTPGWVRVDWNHEKLSSQTYRIGEDNFFDLLVWEDTPFIPIAVIPIVNDKAQWGPNLPAKGDKLVCINSKGMSRLVEGETYTFLGLRGNSSLHQLISLEELSLTGIFLYRFIPQSQYIPNTTKIQSEPKIGDRLTCIYPELDSWCNSVGISLKAGDIVEVLELLPPSYYAKSIRVKKAGCGAPYWIKKEVFGIGIEVKAAINSQTINQKENVREQDAIKVRRPISTIYREERRRAEAVPSRRSKART